MVRSAPFARVSNHEARYVAILRDAAKTPLLRMRAHTTGDRSLRRCHHDLHDMRRFEIDADAGPHRWILRIDPFVPGAVHLALPLHVGDVDDGREDLAFIRAAQREALVDP